MPPDDDTGKPEAGISPPKASSAAGKALVPFFLIFATVAAYFPILGNDFVALDDQATIYGNPYLTHFTGYSFYVFWTRPYMNLYAPLTYTLLAGISFFAHAGSGAARSSAIPFHAWPFHAVSLLLHVLAMLVVYKLLRCFVRRPWPAAVGALLFSLHPVQVETVAWATEINGLLCVLLSLTAILLYLRSKGISGNAMSTVADQCMSRRQQRSWYILATEAFLFAMLAKPLGVMVPLLAGVLYWASGANKRDDLDPRPQSCGSDFVGSALRTAFSWMRNSVGSADPTRIAEGHLAVRRRFPWGLLFWLILAAPLAIIARLSQPIPEGWVYVPFWIRPFVAGDALAFYLYKLFVPMTLVPDYNRSPNFIRGSFAVFYTWVLPAAVGAGLLRFCWRNRERIPLAAGAIWFVVALFPVLGLTPFSFQHMSTVADRYLYLPMFGVALCAAWVLDRLTQTEVCNTSQRRRTVRRCTMGLSITVLGVLGARTFLQTHYWHNTKALYDHSIEVIGRKPGAFEGAPW